MTYNELISHPLKYHFAKCWADIYFTIIIKTGNLTVLQECGHFPDFYDNNFGCGTKKCMWAGTGNLNYYKSWSNTRVHVLTTSVFAFSFNFPKYKIYISSMGFYKFHCFGLILFKPSKQRIKEEST